MLGLRQIGQLLLPALLLCLHPLAAQTRLGSISGIVQDPTAAGIEGARVTVRNTANGTSRHATTALDGRYRVLALDLGDYDILVEAPGFQNDRKYRIPLNVDREAALLHVLAVAEQLASTTVTADVRQITAAGLSNLILADTIQEQPLNGRDYLRLALLQPGVTLSRARAAGNNTGYGLQLSINGSRPVQNNFRLDGVSLTDFTGSSIGSVNGVNLGVDALREFAVLASGFSAEYGRAGGGIVNAVTRSGGNEFHGTLSYFHRNDNLDARNFFDPARQPDFRRHQYGATAGGPIRRNKTFFFAGYEALRQVRGTSAVNTTLSDNARQGLLAAGPVTIDPAIARILKFFPSPNGPVIGDTGIYTYTNNTSATENFTTSRADHYVSDRHTLFARYSFDDGVRDGSAAFASSRTRTATRQQSFALEETQILSATLVNSLRFGITRALSINNLTTALNPDLDDPKFRMVPGAPSVGRLDVGGLSLFPGGSGAEDFDRHAFTSLQLYDDLSSVRGRHWLKAGFSLERTRLNADSRSLNAGELRFPTVKDFLENRSDRFRALLPGADTIRGLRQWIAAWYLQDRWQVLPSLSLEFGLRHEWISVPNEVQGKVSNLDSLLSPAMRIGEPLFDNPSLRNLAPRLGLAWDVGGSGRTVIRAGYGIYHDQILSPYLLISAFRNPPAYVSALTQGLKTGRFPAAGYTEIVTSPRIDARAERLPRHPSQPYVQQWNLNIQQTLWSAGILRLSYAGSHGVHLSGLVEDANLAPAITLPDGRLFFPDGAAKLNPNFGTIRDRIFEGQAFYNSFQAGWTFPAHQRLRIQTSYQLSKSIDDDSSSFSQSESSNSIGIPVTGNSRFNRGLSSNDQRHNFVTSLTAELGSPTSPLLRPFLGGWRVSSIVTLGSGSPFTVTLAYDAARTLTTRSDYRGGQRPDLAPGVHGNLVTGDPNAWFDVTAFSRPSPGFLGNLGRNTITGPGFASADAVLAKRLLLRDRLSIDLRLESFNLLNRTNFNLPESERMQLFNRTGVREDAGRITSAAPGREMQAGIKVQF